MSNIIYSTCPIIPKYHTTFGEPIDRQEISSEFEQTKDADPKKGQALKLMGRIDKILHDESNDLYLVQDDYGFNIMYDCTFMDMRLVEQEVLKIVSFYINRVEPMQDRDLRNVLPCVDRLAILKEVLEWEQLYQRAKLRLCLQYVECYDHTCDVLEQQRLIQIIVDLMAKRPRMNLAAIHFKDSYRAEIDALETQIGIVKDFVRMQMDIEFRANNDIREILEKTYRLVYEQINNSFQQYPKADVEDEVTKRNIQTKGVGGDETKVNQLKDIEKTKPGMFHAKKYAVDPMQFAEMLGVPFSSLEMLMKQHHERDPVVKTSLHEHVSFIKIQEGYPVFIYNTAVKAQNKVSLGPESSRQIGILDFYESLANLPKVISAIQNACDELHDVHKPDNGFMSSAIDVVTLQFLHAELKAVRAEEYDGDRVNSARDLDLIADDSIVGNSDKMLFHMKDLVASIEDPELIQNPFVMTKLDLKSISDFNFDDYQGTDKKRKKIAVLGSDGNFESIASVEGSLGAIETNSDDKSIGDVYMDGFKEEDSEEEFEKKLAMQQKNKESQQPRLKQKKYRANIPSLLEISCNSVEVIRLRASLIDVLIQREDLTQVYKSQMQVMAKDGRINFKDSFNFSTFLSGTVSSGRWKNFVDTGPGLQQAYPTNLAVSEFDPTMVSCLNFSDPEAFKALLCPLGLEELRVVYRYELTNLNLLIAAVRTNQVLLDNLQRQLSELDLLTDGYTVSNPVNLFQNNLNELNFKRIPDERRNTAFQLQTKVGPFFYNIMNRKARSRESIEKVFQKCRLAMIANAGEKTEVLLRQMRTCRMLLAHDYLEELQGFVCFDHVRLELLHETNEMRRRAYLLPRESMVHRLPHAKNGEHSYAAYNEADHDVKVQFFNEDDKKIQFPWAVPSFAEIFAIETGFSEFAALNHADLYKFDLGEPGKQDEYGRPILSEFVLNKQIKLIKAKLPQINYIDLNQSEMQHANFQRVVDFQECYKFTANRTQHYLYYMRQFQNLFDLEFFASKLPSSSYSIAGLEQQVLSGVPFWEDDDGELSDLDSDEYLDNSATNNPMYADQSDAVDSPHRNQLALKVVARIAEEKRLKMKLLQEIELMKDKFAEISKFMTGLDLNRDIRQAGEFLNQLIQQNYYSLMLVLMSMQDTHGAAGTGVKEMHQIREVLRQLSHQDDGKVTYTNGFHVNSAVTSTSRIPLDDSPFKPDYDNFFKAVQPVIDEEAMNPTEFTLLSGLMLARYSNNYSYRKDRRYQGHMPKRDYHYLDCKLINIDADLRKYLTSALIGIDSQSKSYACARLKTTEAQYKMSINLYREVMQERRVFTKQLIRSKILKRALMVLMSRGTIPLDKVGAKALHLEFSETFSWKVMTKMDEIERQRQLAATQDQMKRQKLERMRGDKVKALQGVMQNQIAKKADKGDESVLHSFDQATCEVDVYSHEIQSYMILTGKRIVERESQALAKCFEMNGKRQQILVHPMQQFASTFDQAIDKKSHLDIINKVDSVQRMLTQFMNRCLPIETLTSGAGYTISDKDMKECLTDLCRAMVKSCEIEMRTRCEQLSMLILQYENLLYTKDMQLLNLENKLKNAKEELNKIINTKVFSRGNNLIYELDMSTRQLRLMKDNIFAVEKGIKEKTRLYFDKDLEQTRVLLAEQKAKFKEYQLSLNSYMRENVTSNINYVDEIMKKRVETFKDIHAEEEKLKSGDPSQKTLPSHSVGSMAQIPNHLLDRPNDRRKELMEKYSHLLKKGNVKEQPTAAALDPFNSNTDHDDNYEVIFEEMERLKQSETEARGEVLQLQNWIRQSRMLQKLKEAVQKQKFDYKMDNMKQQLSSNAVLWEQLAEAEKREKILKQELMKVQNENAAQDKVLERLRDEMKLEQIEKHKLIQFKTTKVKRLNHLEGMARQMELLQSVDLDKVIQSLADKDKRLKDVMSKNADSTQFMNEVYRVKAKEVDSVKRQAAKETVLKEVAIAKMEELRGEVQILQGDQDSAYSLQKEEIKKLRHELQAQKSQNNELKNALHQISSTVIPSPTFSSSFMPHDDSVYSVQPNKESPHLAYQGNPFASDAKKHIKKMNTEAYLGVQSHAVARYAAGLNADMSHKEGRNLNQMETSVLTGPTKNDITNELTSPAKHVNALKNKTNSKTLLKTFSDATVQKNSLNQATTAAGISIGEESNTTGRKNPQYGSLNQRSGDFHPSQSDGLNSIKNQRGLSQGKRFTGQGNDQVAYKANLAFGQKNDYATLQVGHGNSRQKQMPHQVYTDAMRLVSEQDPDNILNQAVLGGQMLTKNTDMSRISFQSPKSMKKAANQQAKAQMQGNVYNSVHLPSLRGQSTSFNSSKYAGTQDESLEAFRDTRKQMRDLTTGKKMKLKQATDSNLGPLIHNKQAMQANMLMSMQVQTQNSSRMNADPTIFSGSLGLAKKFNKVSQSNAALLHPNSHLQSTSNPDIVLKGTHKPLNPMGQTLSPRHKTKAKNQDLAYNRALQANNVMQMTNSGAQTLHQPKIVQSGRNVSNSIGVGQEDNLFSSLIQTNTGFNEEANILYSNSVDMMQYQNTTNGQKRVVFGKKPMPQHMLMAQLHGQSADSLADLAIIQNFEGSVTAGGSSSDANKIQVFEGMHHQPMGNESETATANQDANQGVSRGSITKNGGNLHTSSDHAINAMMLEDEDPTGHMQQRHGNDSELVQYAANETARTGQFAASVPTQEQMAAAYANAPDRGTLTKPSETVSLENTLQPMMERNHMQQRDTEMIPSDSHPGSQTELVEHPKGSIGSTVNLMSNSEMHDVELPAKHRQSQIDQERSQVVEEDSTPHRTPSGQYTGARTFSQDTN